MLPRTGTPPLRLGLVGMVQLAWQHRRLVSSLVARDFANRYVGSALGVLWTVLNPLAFILIYTLVFAHVMHSRLPEQQSTSRYAYSLYLCAGLLPWLLFQETLLRCLTVFLEQRSMLKHQSFPRVVLPVVVLLSATINFAIIYGLFVVFLLVTSQWPGAAIVSVLPLLILQEGIAIGLGIALGTLNVYLRDVGQATTVLLQLWFWLTPIVYPPDVVPEAFRPILRWNPLYGVTMAQREVVYAGQWPDWWRLAPSFAWMLACLLLGLVVFRRLGRDMVDEL